MKALSRVNGLDFGEVRSVGGVPSVGSVTENGAKLRHDTGHGLEIRGR